jgi:DNA-binding transcriptional ArsR family regulator
MDNRVSLCGINCGLCDQYLAGECEICAAEESKKTCEALTCVLEIMKVGSCPECYRVAYCAKRMRSIENCLVFKPRKEFSPGSILLVDSWKDAMTAFSKHVFMGKKGLALTFTDPEQLAREFMLEDAEIKGLSRVKKDDAVYVKDIEAIKEAFTEGVRGKDIVIIDGTRDFIEVLSLQRALELINWFCEKVLQEHAVLLLIAEGLTHEEKDQIKAIITDLKVKDVMRTISNPKRMEILGYLRRKGKSTFTQIYDELGYNVPPKLSFHLRVLRSSGIIDQDEEGIYYVSELGRSISEIIDKIGERIFALFAVETSSVVDKADISKEWHEKYDLYLRNMRRFDSISVDVIRDVEDSLRLIFGRKKTEETFQIIMGDYIWAEKKMTREDLKRMISEIAFVFLAEELPLVDAIEWADELMKKHELK